MEEIRDGYIRVSEVLGRLKDRTKINQLVLKEKCDIGTEVHSNIHMEVLGVPVSFEKFPIRNPITGNILCDRDGNERWERRGIGYFRSWHIWEQLHMPEYVHMEQRLYCDKYMITGQIDALVRFPGDNNLKLLDFKCSYAPDMEIWPMQAHFYWYLLTQNGFTLSPDMYFLQLKPLDKQGNVQKPTLIEFTFDEKVLSRCLDEALLCWEEKKNAMVLD